MGALKKLCIGTDCGEDSSRVLIRIHPVDLSIFSQPKFNAANKSVERGELEET
jgi:hypothetical protein